MNTFKRNILLGVLVCFTFATMGNVLNAQDNDSLWYKANDAYAIGEFGNAIEAYSKIEKGGKESFALYYNLGNAYYKQGAKAKAILYYERALKLDPANSDVKTNLEIAKLGTLDKIDVLPEFILTTWVKDIRNKMSSDKWGYTAIILFAITALLMIGYNFAPSSRQRKFSFAFACASMLFAIFSILFAVNLRGNAASEDFAVITAPVSNVKSAPNSTGNNLFILHEGAKVEVLESVLGWSKIELGDGRQGWIKEGEITII